MSRRSVFVVGLDETHRRHLSQVPLVLEQCDVYGVLTPRELDVWQRTPLHSMFERAVECIDGSGRDVDAITGFGGFPVAPLVSLLCEHYGVAGTPLETVVVCEHEYWSRMIQIEAASSHVLPFSVFDAFDDRAVEEVELGAPMWIRPVSRLMGHLSIRVVTRSDLQRAVSIMRDEMPAFLPAFEDLLGHVDLSPELAAVAGRHCIVEPILGGHRCRVEAYAIRGEIHSYGVVDVVRHERDSILARYQYPSQLPFPVQDEVKSIVGGLGRRLGLATTPFNVELVWDEAGGRLWVLEMNAGAALGDVDLFEMVDGTSGYGVGVALALGQRPDYVHGRGRFGCAAKFLVRTLGDAVVTRTPTPEELARLERALPTTHVDLRAVAGDRLRCAATPLDEGHDLAWVSIGGFDASELLEDYELCKPMLHFGFSEPGTRWH